MASRQPLTGRGLSSAVLQAPDVIGEAMQYNQLGLQREALRQKNAPKPKRYEFEGLEEFGQLYDPAYSAAAQQIYDFAEKHAYEINPESDFYDSNIARKFNSTVREVISMGNAMRNANDVFYETYNELPEDQKSITGAAKLLNTASKEIAPNITLDFETGGVGVRQEDGTIKSWRDYGEITDPTQFYYIQQTWDDDIGKKIVTPYTNVETGQVTIRQADLPKIKNQIANNFKLSANNEDFQKSVIADYIRTELGVPNPSPDIINEVYSNGEYIDGNTVVTRDDALGWGEDFMFERISNQVDYGKTEDEERKPLNIGWSFGDWSTKSGVRPIDARKIYYGDGVEFPVGAVSLPTDTYKVPVSQGVFPDQEPGKVASAYVDVVYTDGDNVFANLRGVKQDGTYMVADRVPLNKAQVGNLEGDMKIPPEKTLMEILEEAGAMVGNMKQEERKSDSEQQKEEVVTNPTQEQYDALPNGAKYIYDGVTYTKGE